jgi:anti-sigma B factor antagonist
MTAAVVALRHRGSGLPEGSTVIRLGGDLDIGAATSLRERLISVLRPGTRLLVLDLSAVLSCDLSGVGVLIGTQRRARRRGIVVHLVAPSPPVAELLNSTGLDRYLAVYPDLPGALAGGGGGPAAAAAVPGLIAG